MTCRESVSCLFMENCNKKIKKVVCCNKIHECMILGRFVSSFHMQIALLFYQYFCIFCHRKMGWGHRVKHIINICQFTPSPRFSNHFVVINYLNSSRDPKTFKIRPSPYNFRMGCAYHDWEVRTFFSKWWNTATWNPEGYLQGNPPILCRQSCPAMFL